MAIYHLRAQTGSRLRGQSAKAKADYIQREGKYRDQEDKLVYKESGNMPEWAEEDPSDYWGAADTYERANGRLYKEVEVALPKELEPEDQIELAREFAAKLTEKERLPYTLAVHEGKGENPHAHVMISERMNDGIERSPETWFRRANREEPEQGGALKTESMKPKAWLTETRELWGREVNGALEHEGHEVRVDHRSLEAQGIERIPTRHIGVHALAMEARGIRTERGDMALEIDRLNREIEQEKAAFLEAQRQLEGGVQRQRERGLEY